MPHQRPSVLSCHIKKTTAMFTREIRLGKIIVIPKFLVVSLLQKKKKKRKKRNPCCQVHLPLFSVTLTLNSRFPKTLSSQKHWLNSSKWPLVLLLLSLCVYLFPYITPSSTISHTLLSPSLIFASFELFRSFFQTNPFISNLNLTNFIKLRKFVVLDFLSWVDIFGLKIPLRLLKKKKKKKKPLQMFTCTDQFGENSKSFQSLVRFTSLFSLTPTLTWVKNQDYKSHVWTFEWGFLKDLTWQYNWQLKWYEKYFFIIPFNISNG